MVTFGKRVRPIPEHFHQLYGIPSVLVNYLRQIIWVELVGGGDIVVLIDPRDTNVDLIKRVIGLPGETVEIVDGKVYINDMLLEEPYITQAWHDTKPKVTIPPGEYFVMGDNRENSLDSRSSQVGLVPQDLIIGKAMVSYWPSSKFGFAPNEEGKLSEEKPVLTTRKIGED